MPEKTKDPDAPKKTPPTHELAYWFVNHFLSRPFDYRLDRQRLAEASELVNPKAEKEVRSFPVKTARLCLLMMEAGEFGFKDKIQSIRCVLWGRPPYIEQCEKWLETPPPFWNAAAVKVWELTTGKVAYPDECAIIPPSFPVPAFITMAEEE